ESLVGAYLINRWSDGVGTFDTPTGVAKFALICFVPSTMISATLGVVSLSLSGYADWADFASIWMTWLMGDLTGALVIAPVIVLWTMSFPRSAGPQELAQSCAVFGAVIAVGLIAFSPLIEQTASRGPLAFLAVLPLMWAALRRNQRDTATTALILACFAVWGTASNGGPFARTNLNDSFLLLLAFMISISVPSLALSADVATRKRHEDHVEFVMHELSHRSKNLLAVVPGTVNIQWQLETTGRETGQLRIGWRERGGPAVNELQKNGFGHMITTKIVPVSLRGKASLQVEPEGVQWTLVVPASSVLAKG